MTAHNDQSDTAAVIAVAEIPLTSTTPAQAVDDLLNAARARRAQSIRLLNAYCIALSDDDGGYKRLLTHDGINYPDGAPVAWFMRRKARPDQYPRRVRGPSLFTAALSAAAHHGLSVYFLGTTDDTLSQLERNARRKFPGLVIAGSWAPPFVEEVTAEFIQVCAERVEESQPDILWVGLGTPKQDYVTSALARQLEIPCVGVGAAFDFVAQTIPEAPTWMQRAGVEWLFRLSSEPRRLWKRYLIGNWRFLAAATRRNAADA